MTEELKKKISKLKPYYIIFLGCILGSLLILNSNYINEQKATLKLNKEKTDLFNSIISKRRLEEEGEGEPVEQEDEEVIYLTDEVCKLASSDLNEYYKTNDLSKIGLDDGPIKSEDGDKDYIKALIDIVKGLVESDKENETPTTGTDPETPGGEPGEPEGTGGSGGTGGRRRLGSINKETEENIKKYVNHILSIAIFLGIGLLGIIGWVACCFCACCKCCCCCCCKKESCRIPAFIFTVLFYALVIAVCIYGFTQTSKIFTGIANTECSFMIFFDDILYGEIKEERPKWIGINGVSEILNKFDEEIKEMEGSNLPQQLDYYIGEISDKRDEFIPELQKVHRNFYQYTNEGMDEIGPKDEYCLEYESSDNAQVKRGDDTLHLEGKYVLDIIPLFGKYENDEYSGYISAWNTEISEIDEQATNSLNQAKGSFNTILGENLETIKEGLSAGKTNLEELRKPFDNVYTDISDALYDSSQYINQYGKLTVKLVFGVLGLMNIFLCIFIMLICICSGKTCGDCCLCRCVCKCALHILWNFLAFFLIISFLFGSILSLIGIIGADLMEVFSYIVSQENFDKGDNAIIVNELGEGSSILRECFVGSGDISAAFELNGVTQDFDVIKEKKNEIEGYIDQFEDLAMRFPSYNLLKSLLEDRTEFRSDTTLNLLAETTPDGVASSFKLNEIISLLDESIGSESDERWDQNDGDKEFKCEEGVSQTTTPINDKLHPWTCEPLYRNWVSISTNNNLKNYAKIATDIIGLLKYANGTKGEDHDSYYDILEELQVKYKNYLNKYKETLYFFDDVIGRIINLLDDAIGDSGDTFSFLNGKFIKIDLKIILKYLKYSLGEDIYTVGVCLIIVGFSLIFSVSSTILLNVVIDIVYENNKKSMNPLDPTQIPEYGANNDGRVVQYKY